MSKSTVIHFSGNISVDVTSHVSSLLEERRPGIELEIGELSTSARLTITPDDLAMAAAIAAVLSFLLDVYTAWQERKERKQAEQEHEKNNLRDALNRELQSFGADGFEIKDLEQLDQSILEHTRKIALTLEDVPGKQLIEMEMTIDCHVKIRRRDVQL